jgi:hypothetical protein
MRRILVAAAALAAAAGVSGALLLTTARPPAGEAFALTRDVPAGGPVTADMLRVARADLGEAAAAMVGPSSRSVLDHALATHDLRSGQLLERADVTTVLGGGPDRRYVFVAIKDVPPVTAGERIDLLSVTGAGDHLVVAPFALGLEIRAVTNGGLVLVTSSRQAPGLVYASISVRLIAVVADPGARPGQEVAVEGFDQAAQAVHG